MLPATFASLALFTLAYAAIWTRALLPLADKRPTLPALLTGFVTNFFDTLGIGSFATTTSIFKFTRMVPDQLIPGTLNAGHTLPTIFQAFIYIAVIQVDPSTLLLMIAGAVVGLAFASQDTIKNVFGAVMLIVDQPFTLGDFINTGTHEGKVEALGLRSTTIELLDGQKLAIPNGDLANRAIVNITRRDFIRAQDLVHLEVNTPSEKIQQAVTLIRESLVDHEGFDSHHPPLVHVTEFSDWAVNIRLMYWFRPANAAKQLEFNQKLLLRISEKLQAAGIRLAAQGTPQAR